MLLAIALAKGAAMPTSELEVSRGSEKRDSLQLAVTRLGPYYLMLRPFNHLVQLSEVIIEHGLRRLEHLRAISLKGRVYTLNVVYCRVDRAVPFILAPRGSSSRR